MTEHLTDTTLILPVFHQLTRAEQDRVIAVLHVEVLQLENVVSLA